MPEESLTPAKKLRQNGQIVDVVNDGLWVFLYDESHTALLIEEEALKILDGGQTKAKQQRELAKRGLIVAYELYQDDGILAELAVGPPLSAREKKRAKWVKPQKAFLSLPSGRLRIDSANTLPFGEDPPDDSEDDDLKGARFDVPPGDYVITLHRVDWDQLGEKHCDPPEFPNEFISLTPCEKLRPPKKLDPILTWDAAVGTDERWLREWKIEEGVFHGVGCSGSRRMVTNLQPQAVNRLGLRWGAKIRFRGDGWQREAVYLGSMNTHYLAMVYGPGGEMLGRSDGQSAAEATHCDVVLTACGKTKMNIVKAVKDVTGASLLDARKMVEGLPVTLKVAVAKKEAEKLKSLLEEAGGTAALTTQPPGDYATLSQIDSRGNQAVELSSDDLPTAPEGAAVSIEARGEPYAAPPDSALRGKTSVDGGTLNAFVLAASPCAVVLNFGLAELSKIEADSGNVLILCFDAMEREIHLDGRTDDSTRAIEAAMLELIKTTPEWDRLEQRIEKCKSLYPEEHIRAMTIGSEICDAAARLVRAGFEFPADVLPRMPLIGTVMHDWEVDDAEVFVLTPLCGSATGLDVASGVPVSISATGQKVPRIR